MVWGSGPLAIAAPKCELTFGVKLVWNTHAE